MTDNFLDILYNGFKLFINCLFSYIDEDGKRVNGVTVLDVFHKRICLLLKEKESTVMAYTPSNWLSHEAASLECVNKAGTFR